MKNWVKGMKIDSKNDLIITWNPDTVSFNQLKYKQNGALVS